MVALKFDYGTSRLKDLRIQTTRTPLGKEEVTGLELKGEPVKPSKRFWTSLQMRFGFTPNIFRYFSHAEVFRRISERCDKPASAASASVLQSAQGASLTFWASFRIFSLTSTDCAASSEENWVCPPGLMRKITCRRAIASATPRP